MALGPYPELQPGSELLARSLTDAAAALTIRVSSNELARGGTAVILKGDVVSPWPVVVALKVVMDVHREDSDHYHERIRREIAAVEQIQHRFILPFLGVAFGASYTVLVSQFMENGDLLEYLKAKPGADRRLLIIQVADAVNYLHSQAGLVHGDLKCQNVLVSAHGDAQLADFGLSTLVDKSLSTDTTTVGIRQSYTLQFAAPEMLADEAKSPSGKTRSKTPQTDVFAFGRLMLQAFTGTVPWPDLPMHAVFHRVLKNVTPDRRDDSAALGLDDNWWSVCVACWRTKPKDRPTMAEVLLDLRDGGGDVSRRRPAKPWSLPSIFTKLARPTLPSTVTTLPSTVTVALRDRRPSVELGPPAPSVLLPSFPLRSPASDGEPTWLSDDGTGSVPLDGYRCNSCQQPIVGVRYQCATCPSSPRSYDLCEACETKSYIVHDDTHIFFKLPRPVKRHIRSPSPLLPQLYRRPAGLRPDGTRDDADPEGYLRTLRNPMALCDWCVERIEGKWYRCAYCGKDLCDACEAIDVHDDSHVFVVFKAQVDMGLLRDLSDLENPAPLIQYPIY